MADEQEFKLLITGDASGYVGAAGQAGDATKRLKVDTSDLSDETKKSLGIFNEEKDNLKKIPDPADEAGNSVKGFSLKGREAREIIGELNHILPGLGSVLRGVGIAAEESGAAVAAGEGEVTAGAEAMQSSILPLLALMLAIKAIMEYWDLYQESVKAAAEANANACKKMEEDTAKALKAWQELDAALHPKKKDVATQDEDALKKKLRALEEDGERQKAVNKANEQRELENATSPQQKKEIEDRYRRTGEELDESQQAKKAQIEAAAADAVRKQIDYAKQASQEQVDIQAKAYADKKKASEEIDRLEASKASTQTTTTSVTGGTITVTDDKKLDAINAQIEAQKKIMEAADKTYNDATNRQVDYKNTVGALGERQQDFSNESQADVDKYNAKHKTNREVNAVRNRGAADERLLNATAPNSNETLKTLLTETGKTHAQTEVILNGILGHTLNLQAVLAQLQGQLNQQKAQLGQGSFNRQ